MVYSGMSVAVITVVFLHGIISVISLFEIRNIRIKNRVFLG